MRLCVLYEKYLAYRPRKKHRTPGDITDKTALQQTQDMADLTVNLMPSMTSVTNWDDRGRPPRGPKLKRQG
jgi:hypothetical protein